ncbi:MAG: 50S ribosomal protein L24 [Spirochaetales bacterium]|nr:50S ribosomal protein L24 [Spirochaetales bacterium]
MKQKIKKNDTVKVMTGKNEGKTGRVIKFNLEKNQIYIESVNMVKKAIRPSNQNQKGGIIEIEAPIHISNVQLVCKKCGPTRIGFKTTDSKKIRICKKCGEEI